MIENEFSASQVGILSARARRSWALLTVGVFLVGFGLFVLTRSSASDPFRPGREFDAVLTQSPCGLHYAVVEEVTIFADGTVPEAWTERVVEGTLRIGERVGYESRANGDAVFTAEGRTLRMVWSVYFRDGGGYWSGMGFAEAC